MLFITHDLELAAAICDRTAVMYAGQIVEIRASARLHDDPLHPYTAALAAARPDIARTRPRLRAIPGRPLSAFEAPPGQCAFAPRCPHAAVGCRRARARRWPSSTAACPGARGRPNCAACWRWPMPDPGAVLAVTGLGKKFGDFTAVDDVSVRAPAARARWPSWASRGRARRRSPG